MTERGKNIDWLVFIATAAIVVGASAFLILMPEAGSQIVNHLFDFITVKFGIVYILAANACLLFLGWLAFGPYGKIRLGSEAEHPAFSTRSWTSMLFCAGIGTSIMHWGTIEWAYYFQDPPFGLEAGSAEATAWAGSYGLFHWGVTGWAFYALPAVSLAYIYHVRQRSALRLSVSCEALLGKYTDGIAGRSIDLLFMVGLLGASGTGLGFTTPLMTSSMSQFFGVPEAFWMTIVAVLVLVVIFSVSVYAGIEKGIKRLSNFNVIVTFMLLFFILVAGPTRFILEAGTSAIGRVMHHFLLLNTWSDPFAEGAFVENWTVFYWAWWIALGPTVGMFVAKISKGRTIRELILGVLGYGTLGCVVCFVILGNYAMYLQLEGKLPVVDLLNQFGAAYAVVQVIGTLPTGTWLLPLFCLLCTAFAATSYDSVSYTLAAATTRRLEDDEDPERWNRMFWAMTLGVLPVTLLFLGGLKSLQTASVLASLPLLFIGVLMAWSLVRALREDSSEN